MLEEAKFDHRRRMIQCWKVYKQDEICAVNDMLAKTHHDKLEHMALKERLNVFIKDLDIFTDFERVMENDTYKKFEARNKELTKDFKRLSCDYLKEENEIKEETIQNSE